jgi:hypothetical protein
MGRGTGGVNVATKEALTRVVGAEGGMGSVWKMGVGCSGCSGDSGTGCSGVGTKGVSGVSGVGCSGVGSSGVGCSGVGTKGVSGFSGTGYSGVSDVSGTGSSGVGVTGVSGVSGSSGVGTTGVSGSSGWVGGAVVCGGGAPGTDCSGRALVMVSKMGVGVVSNTGTGVVVSMISVSMMVVGTPEHSTPGAQLVIVLIMVLETTIVVGMSVTGQTVVVTTTTWARKTHKSVLRSM